MSIVVTISAFLAGMLVGVGVASCKFWQTRGQRQEQLARHVEPVQPQQTDALAISEQDREIARRLVREALG